MALMIVRLILVVGMRIINFEMLILLVVLRPLFLFEGVQERHDDCCVREVEPENEDNSLVNRTILK
jgi:hypothetical protein